MFKQRSTTLGRETPAAETLSPSFVADGGDQALGG